MAIDLVCPHCSARLRLSRPVLLPARVKCRLCHARFYAGGDPASVPTAALSVPAAVPVSLIPTRGRATYFGPSSRPLSAIGWGGRAAGFALWATGLAGLGGLILAAAH